MTEFLWVRKFRIERFIYISCTISLCKSNTAESFLFRLIDMKSIFWSYMMLRDCFVPRDDMVFEYTKSFRGDGSIPCQWPTLLFSFRPVQPTPTALYLTFNNQATQLTYNSIKLRRLTTNAFLWARRTAFSSAPPPWTKTSLTSFQILHREQYNNEFINNASYQDLRPKLFLPPTSRSKHLYLSYSHLPPCYYHLSNYHQLPCRLRA